MAASGNPDQPPGPPPGKDGLGNDAGNDIKKTKDADMVNYSRIDQDGKMKFSCNKCNFVAEKESGIKKHINANHMIKTVTKKISPKAIAGKKRKVMESSKKESVSKERKVTEGEDNDSLSLSVHYASVSWSRE